MSRQAGAFGIKVGDSTGVWSASGVFLPVGDFDSEPERGCGVLGGFGEEGSQSYERVER